MIFISYAQNYEDVMLRRALKEVGEGFYIDVGANDPVVDSVTKTFYDAGWHGINIEPVTEWYEKLEQDRPNDINLQSAVGEREGNLDFYEVVGTGLSTMDESIAKRHAQEHGYEIKSYQVPVIRLTTICEQHPHSDIHFLKIDVEGAELRVLQSLDLKIIRPWIIVVESTLPNSQIENYEEWEYTLTERGYHYVYFDGLNRYYVADEHDELDEAFTVPPNCFDYFKRAGEFRLERQLDEERGASNTQIEVLVSELASEKNNVEPLNKELGEKHEAWLASESTQAHSQWLQNEWDIAKARLEGLVGELATEKTNLEHRNTLLGEKSEALARSEEALAEQQAHSQWLQNEWVTAKHKIDELHQSNHHWWSTADQQNKELEEVRNKSDELNHSSHHWWLEADRLNKELQTFYNSTSWRVTWPLRAVMSMLRWLIMLPCRLLKWLLRPLAVSVISQILRRPVWVMRLRGLKTRFPGLYAKARSIARARGLVGGAVPGSVDSEIQKDALNVSSIGDDSDSNLKGPLESLSSSAKAIYLDLLDIQLSSKNGEIK